MTIEPYVQIAGAALLALAALRAAYSLTAIGISLRKSAATQNRERKAFEDLLAKRAPSQPKHNIPDNAPWSGTRKFRVVHRQSENLCGDICSFQLRPLDERAIAPFRPGQFLTLAVSPGPEASKKIHRTYSISNSPTDADHYRITVKRQVHPRPGLVSNHLHNTLKHGDIVEASAPAGNFFLDPSETTPAILIAGGVGITPLIAMLEWLTKTRSQREVWLFLGARNRAEHPMQAQLAEITRVNPNAHIVVAYSRPTPRCRTGIDYHVKGHITAPMLKPLIEGRRCTIYMCGPAAMMTSIGSGLVAMGVPHSDVRAETFAPPARAQRHTKTLQAATTTHRIEFTRSGRTLQWTPEDGSILDLAEENGIKAQCACRQGICGSCVAALASGKVGYETQPANTPQPGMCLPCIAQPQSDIAVDL